MRLFQDKQAFGRMLTRRKAWSVMLRAARILVTKLLTPGASEKFHAKRILLTVPTTSTSALAEKAKTCKLKSTKGTRQFGPVASA